MVVHATVNMFKVPKTDNGRVCEMKLQEIRDIAKMWSVNARVGRKKQDIIRDIQMSEGYSPCFQTKEACENDCLWKNDCTNNK